MVVINERDGIFTLEGEEFSIKIDNNRKIYVKKKNENKFNSIGSELDIGYTAEEKKKYIYNLYLSLKDRAQEMNKNSDQEQKHI